MSSFQQLEESASRLREVVENNWPFDQDHYPNLKEESYTEIRNFGFEHMTLHLAKDAGVLARIQERAHHRSGRTLPTREWRRIKKIAMKAIVSGFRLFNLADGRPEELVAYILKEKRKSGERR